MQITLPPSQWIKAVGAIQGLGTSGWDWLTPESLGSRSAAAGSSGFVEGTVNAMTGDLFVAFNIGKKPDASGQTILYMAIPTRNPLICVATAPTNVSWSISLLGKTKPLLAMSRVYRTLYGLDLRLADLAASRDRSAGTMAAITEATAVRATYTSSIGISSEASSQAAWITAAFELFLLEQCSYLDTSRSELLETLQEHYTQLGHARVPPSALPQRQTPQPRLLPAVGRIQLRQRKPE
jgi:hypothetical protein